ncbi:DUF5977 domain-containing protein [Flavobacterium ginsenosidimutans]|uniref:DUF5977 domain-containing protein n=1 Tax=Flavobacterium ginsenosidimutans TaxID=687844 RepID=UPI000DAB6424|nr:DUF5977 domain-containing protein [Flavobacterium ginsenosidimutans]KAF2330543.1 hypothetical protein DM444_14465 [Flavobacterium ginsenosidimutans]
MGNTGYKFYETLEQYYTDDGTSTGETKQNVKTDPDYIAPFQDEVDCPPQVRFYNTMQTRTVSKNNCSPGYSGSAVTLTASPNQFVSNESVLDANNQAIAWLDANAQIYANNVGTCIITPTTNPTVPTLRYAYYGGETMTLQWPNYIDPGAITYELYRSINGGTPMLLQTSTDTFYYDKLSNGVTYSYQIRINSNGYISSYSNTVTVTGRSS